MTIKTLQNVVLEQTGYSDKNWALNMVSKICRNIDLSEFATECQSRNEQPKSVQTSVNLAQVDKLTCIE